MHMVKIVKPPNVKDTVKLLSGYHAGCRARVVERRKNGLYRVILLDGADQGIERYGLAAWELERVNV